jgi:thymidylate synthase
MGGLSMKVIVADSAQSALQQGLRFFADDCNYSFIQSRAGKVRAAHTPVTTVYHQPWNRVLLDPIRDANPFFHLFESLWILAGRNDVEFLTQFNKKMSDYSDNKKTFHGAYGWRISQNGNDGIDQLTKVIDMIKANPKDRRCVMSIWDPALDLGAKSLDIPCNDMIKVDASRGKIDLTVFNRSNDMIWGAYGANVVQFSMIQEYISLMTGIPVGTYYQVSTDYHVYEDVYLKLMNKYFMNDIEIFHHPIRVMPSLKMDDPENFDYDLFNMFDAWEADGPIGILTQEYKTEYFKKIVQPMAEMFFTYKTIGTEMSCNYNYDWNIAGAEWVQRRISAKEDK